MAHLRGGDGCVKAKDQGNHKIHDGATPLNHHCNDNQFAKLKRCFSFNEGETFHLSKPARNVGLYLHMDILWRVIDIF